MPEIASFNQLFWEARLNNIRLDSLRQLDNGNFVAEWRGAGVFASAGEWPTPFDALLKSYLMAAAGAEQPPAPWFE